MNPYCHQSVHCRMGFFNSFSQSYTFCFRDVSNKNSTCTIIAIGFAERYAMCYFMKIHAPYVVGKGSTFFCNRVRYSEQFSHFLKILVVHCFQGSFGRVSSRCCCKGFLMFSTSFVTFTRNACVCNALIWKLPQPPFTNFDSLSQSVPLLKQVLQNILSFVRVTHGKDFFHQAYSVFARQTTKKYCFDEHFAAMSELRKYLGFSLIF